ncbi:MAG: hypothetical protein AB4426_18965 [Xenococcaceae cyanobacterium]
MSELNKAEALRQSVIKFRRGRARCFDAFGWANKVCCSCATTSIADILITESVF